MKAFQWIPDPAGDITVIEKFREEECREIYVPPLIAYADLTEGDDARYMETASIFYEKQLRDIL